MRQVKSLAGDNVYKILLGNKSDLKEQRKVSQLEIDNFCNEASVKYFEVGILVFNVGFSIESTKR